MRGCEGDTTRPCQSVTWTQPRGPGTCLWGDDVGVGARVTGRDSGTRRLVADRSHTCAVWSTEKLLAGTRRGLLSERGSWPLGRSGRETHKSEKRWSETVGRPSGSRRRELLASLGRQRGRRAVHGFGLALAVERARLRVRCERQGLGMVPKSGGIY